MKTVRPNSGFALAITLVLMSLVLIVIVAYLANTQTDRSSSSIYTNRLKAKMMAETGLTAATKLLSDNTKYGNYITARPAQSPSPGPLYTEIYRPTDPADTTKAKADDFLQLTNAAGVILASRAPATPSGTPQIEPRPTPVMIPPAGPFVIADPGFTSSNSYDFNQIVRVGIDASGRLVYPSPTPAYAQWVRVRNSSNELIGRYAFFLEDESMKVNINATGNNLSGGATLRVNDMASPAPSPVPATQIEEIDPTAVLAPAPTPDRAAAMNALTGLGAAGSRLATKSSLALLGPWTTEPAPTPYSTYAHLITARSKDDDTTAKGWQRMDLNALVASTTDNTSKIAIAQRIADWIRDAWTGPPLAGLQDYQMFNDPRLRLQLAANIIDYIDADSIPTDLGNYPGIGVFPPNPAEYPVIGIEKLPYLCAVEIIYQASGSNGVSAANLKMKIRFRFLNLFDDALDLADSVGHIELKGVPILQRNGPPPVFDVSATNYSIQFSSLTPVTAGNGTNVAAGVDGVGDSGARSFETGWLEDRAVTFNGASNVKPVLLAANIEVKVFGLNGERLDDTAIVTNQISTGYNSGSGGSTGDFLKEATPGPLQVASINLINIFPAGGTAPVTTGDPRFRGTIRNSRWYNISRSDASTPVGTNRLDAFVDKAELASRTYAVDWFDSVQVRPLAFHRNGPMLNIGELGNVSAGEYPWRTIYLQYPERPSNTTQIGPITEVPLRRNNAVDFVLSDLFRTRTEQPRAGAININTQQRASSQQHTLNSLFLGVSQGARRIDQAQIEKLSVDPNSSPVPAPSAAPPIYSLYQRRMAVSPPTDDNPVRPFFQVGELASPISRLVNASTRVSGESRSTVTYSILRNNPTLTSDVIADYRSDMLSEQEFREISNSITTRGNVFRILYVGQGGHDVNSDGNIDPSEIQAEYLGEAFVERTSVFQPDAANPEAMKTADSIYKVLANRVITQ